MPAKICRDIERFAAVETHKLLHRAVRAFVTAQAVRPSKAFTTVQAHVRFLVGVRLLVTAELRGNTEGLAALGTLVRPDLATLGAAAGLGVGVRLFPVRPEGPFLPERPFTSAALIAATVVTRHLRVNVQL